MPELAVVGRGGVCYLQGSSRRNGPPGRRRVGRRISEPPYPNFRRDQKVRGSGPVGDFERRPEGEDKFFVPPSRAEEVRLVLSEVLHMANQEMWNQHRQ